MIIALYLAIGFVFACLVNIFGPSEREPELTFLVVFLGWGLILAVVLLSPFLVLAAITFGTVNLLETWKK